MNRIFVNPQIHFGKPCIAGTRITVQSVLELINEELSFEVIVQDYYPDLEIDDIKACVQYAIAVVLILYSWLLTSFEIHQN
jgi:uncharacterized protein (DUF433 family)